MDQDLLRVHSEDLVHHVAEAVGSSFETSLFADVTLRCGDGKTVRAHKVVLAAVSPFLKEVGIEIQGLIEFIAVSPIL